MPGLNDLYSKFSKDGFVLIGLHSDKDTAKGIEAAKNEKMAYPVAFDGGAFMKKMGCDSFPDYVLIDRKGVVRAVDLANGEVPKAVEALLKESP